VDQATEQPYALSARNPLSPLNFNTPVRMQSIAEEGGEGNQRRSIKMAKFWYNEAE
jgi:hypothetical protein